MKISLGAKTLAHPVPAWVVCAYDEHGKATGMTAAWGGICCSKPPMVTVSLRSATHTHGLILARQAFTVNVPPVSLAGQADFFGMTSGRDVDKFAAAGLTAVKSEEVDAPYIAEFPLVVECALVQTVEPGLHTMFVGEIKDVKADESVLDAEGKVDVAKLDTIVYATHQRAYHAIGREIGKAFSMGKEFLNKGGGS